MFRAFRDAWRRVPAERRGLAWLGIGEIVVGGIVVGVLLVVQPWGTNTFVWVILVGGAAVLLVWLMGFSVQAVMDGRPARKRRARNR